MTRINEILDWYGADSPAVLDKLHRLFMQGQLAGTGKLIILPVDQGFEHGPLPSFARNPEAYNPLYHFQLAIEAGCSAYAAPLGFLEAGARQFAGQVPLILKLNNADSLFKSPPGSAVTASLDDALRLGCIGIGFTIYPGSSTSRAMYEQLAHLAREAKKVGLLVVVWAYPRGEALQKQHEQALDVVAYAAHIAAQLGAHIIKVKPPTNEVANKQVQECLDKTSPWSRLAPASVSMPDYQNYLRTRVRHVVQSCFNGRRIVIFSGGPTKDKNEFLVEVGELARGGSFGSIVGRNAFTRPKKEAIELLQNVIKVYKQVNLTE